MDELYWDKLEDDPPVGYYALPQDIVPYEFNLTSENVDATAAYWSNYTPKTVQVQQQSVSGEVSIEEVQIPNLFHFVTSNEFQGETKTSSALISVVPLGLPLHGFESSLTNKSEQYEQMGKWLYDSYDAYLKSLGPGGENDLGDIDVYWSDDRNQMVRVWNPVYALHWGSPR